MTYRYILRHIISLGLLIIIIPFSNAQEAVTGLDGNPVLKNYRQIQPTTNSKAEQTQKKDQIFISLPFFDDFSDSDIYPKANLWSDNKAFINSRFAYLPVSVGVATLDALDENGEIYATAGISSSIADYLTTNYIRLDSIFEPTPKALTPADSIYLSFYYQPQGLGNAPDIKDSLVLEFFCIHDCDTLVPEPDPNIPNSLPVDTIFHDGWQRVWSVAGKELDKTKPFTRIMIPIIDSAKYFNSHFRFRFKNYVSLAGNEYTGWQSNVDMWHIDYIELSNNRHRFDTIPHDMTFVNPATSLLRRYSSMPFHQYRANFIDEMAQHTNILIANMDNVSHNTSIMYNIINEKGEIIKTFDGGSVTIEPFYTSGYAGTVHFSTPPVVMPFPPSTTKTHYTIEHIIKSDAVLLHQENDTIRFKQIFDNYYAYDDGTPEAGYTLSHAGAMLALRFQQSESDTLSTIQFLFNKTLRESNKKPFYIMVWAEDNGKPGKVLYRSEKPVYPTSTDKIFEFSTYDIDPIIFKAKRSIFYVGMQQTTDYGLNLGFDYSKDNKDQLFHYTHGVWQPSVIEGTVMIRPVMGNRKSPSSQPDDSSQKNLVISPNPVKSSSDIHIHFPNNYSVEQPFDIYIYSLNGQLILKEKYHNKIHHSLQPGIYILKAYCAEKQIFKSAKLLITQ